MDQSNTPSSDLAVYTRVRIRETSFQKAKFRSRFKVKVRLKEKNLRHLEIKLINHQSECKRALEVSNTLDSELAVCYQQTATLFDKYDRGLIDDKELNRLLHPIKKNLERVLNLKKRSQNHLRKLVKVNKNIESWDGIYQ